MGTEQIYNPVEGINRMITDIEKSMEPIMFRYHPVMHLLSKINMYIVSVVFVVLLLYILIIRKHSVVKWFKSSKTYIMVIAGLIIFALLNANPIRFGPSFNLNFGFVVIPVISKFLGPVISTIFGLCQYSLQFLKNHGQAFSLSAMLIGGISGMIYALFIYDKRTKYTRCLAAKLSVNLICNIFLSPLALSDTMTAELAKLITDRILENIFLAPIQALVIFAALKLYKRVYKFIRKK